ncbi:MAG: hypothetical protein NXI21_19005 [Alphaproteobacteria bacterium]|nr:hypothetical protein [Alphaproteobacteria bacterium]
MRNSSASPTPRARFGNKTTDISAFEIAAKGALEAEPDRALQELAIIAQRLENPAVRAQLDRMVGRRRSLRVSAYGGRRAAGGGRRPAGGGRRAAGGGALWRRQQ